MIVTHSASESCPEVAEKDGTHSKPKEMCDWMGGIMDSGLPLGPWASASPKG